MSALGAIALEDRTRFAVHAPAADGVELCLFDADDRENRVAMVRDDALFCADVPGVGPGQRYGYRARGRWAPEEGLWFDPAKLLVDPYAVAIDRRFAHDPRLAVFGEDTVSLVPKTIVSAAAPLVPPPPVFREGGLIYELNVRSFTMRHPDVPAEQRGTIAALAHPAIVAHFQRLHVAAVELMPVVAWIDERHLPPPGLRNAWGYNPVVPMALDPALAPGGIAELAATVAALRAAGIGVLLDLVFNHTGESDRDGPVLSLRGLDARGYYAHAADGALINDTGTGNTLDGGSPLVRRLILDSLRHFVGGAGVDGFRFDLAPVMARAPGFDPHAPIFADIAADPLLADRIMIAEPWDVGPGGYQLGRFPGHWLEWNDRYRDDVRRFWRGDGEARTLATRIAGSSDVFGGGRTRGVQFVAAHDGFTLADLVSHERRHNAANGEGNRDGADEVSWNVGAEGASDDPEMRARRDADVRALLATLFASRGTIQLTAGDEFGRTQGGNNNAYAQDNAVTWLDWAGRDRALETFVAALAAFRAAHPVIADPAFLHDADWRGLDGEPMTAARWEAADCTGFELRLPAAEGRFVALRFDRATRHCTLAEIEEVAS